MTLKRIILFCVLLLTVTVLLCDYFWLPAFCQSLQVFHGVIQPDEENYLLADKKHAELISLRAEKSKTFVKKEHGNTIFTYAGSTSPIHYKNNIHDETETWKEIDTTITQSNDAIFDYHMKKAGYYAYFSRDFSAEWIARFEKDGYWINLKPIELVWSNLNGEKQYVAAAREVLGTVTSNTIYWKSAFGPGIDLKWYVTKTQLRKVVIIQENAILSEKLKSLKDSQDLFVDLRIGISYSPELNLEQNGNSGRTFFKSQEELPVWFFTRPRYWLGSEQSKERIGVRTICANPADKIISIKVPFKISALPLFIDTDIDKETTVNGDDAYSYEADSFHGGDTWLEVGEAWGGGPPANTFLRFSGITIPQNSTIAAAYLSIFHNGFPAGVQSKLFADDQNNPLAPVSEPDHTGRSRTTNGVDWDGPQTTGQYIDSPSIVSVIQELVDSYDYNNEAILILWDDDGTTTNNILDCEAHESAFNTEPQLHIEYTVTNETEFQFEGVALEGVEIE